MSTLRVLVPDALTEDRLIAFFRDLGTRPPATTYVFDFQQLSWSPPFGMLLFAALLRQFRKKRPGAAIMATNHEPHAYQAHMGFFTNFGLAHGKAPGQAPGSPSYLPIRILSWDSLAQDAARHGDEVQDAIERHANEISRILSHQHKGALVDTLAYAFREVLRNAMEHSGAPKVGYCAQYWRTRHEAEIAVIDTGCGIRESLSHNPHLEIKSHRDALLQSLLPGVSGKFYKGIRQRRYDNWQNSGFGLFMTSRLCGRGGAFVMLSGDAGVRLQQSESSWFEADFQGTAICAKLRTDRLAPLTQSLAQLDREGSELAREMGLSVYMSASRASRMLARDFNS